MKAKVLMLGELLIRHTPITNTAWQNGAQTQVFFGGSEANIAVTLATLNVATGIVSAVPDNEMGHVVRNYFRSEQVDVDHISYKGNRVGQYYATRGVGIRAGSVTYDRADSSFTKLEVADIDLESVFENVTHFHVSGITIALGENIRAVTLKMLAYAKSQGIVISIDLNYRGKLWDFQSAKRTMATFLPYADICFGIEPVAAFSGEKTIFNPQQATNEAIKARMQTLKDHFNLQQIFHTARKVDAFNHNNFKAYCLNEQNEFIESKVLDTFIVERIGSGDAFVSGILYGMLKDFSTIDMLNLGVYFATVKCTEYGDHLKANKEMITAFLHDEHQGIKR